MQGGGAILYCSGDGGEVQANCNFNYFLEELGINVNSGTIWRRREPDEMNPYLDSVMRTLQHKTFHPKEVVIQNGIVNREINRLTGKKVGYAASGPVNSNSSLLSTNSIKSKPRFAPQYQQRNARIL